MSCIEALSLFRDSTVIWAMEPISALTVACAVVQLVDFGSKIVGTGLKAYKSVDGAPEDIVEIKALAVHAEQLSKRLASSKKTRKLNAGIKDEDNLRELASRGEPLASGSARKGSSG